MSTAFEVLVARTQAQRKAETRRRLLDAAAELFARAGFHATSTDAVADRAERTSGSVYAHFGGKEGLLLALLEEMKDATAAAILADLDDADTDDDRIAVLWRQFAAPPAERSHWVLLEHELWLHAARNPANARTLAQRYDRERSRMASELAVQTHSSDPLPATDLAKLVLALLLGLEMQRRLDPAAVSDDLAVEGIERLLGLDHRHQPTSVTDARVDTRSSADGPQ